MAKNWMINGRVIKSRHKNFGKSLKQLIRERVYFTGRELSQ